MVRGAVNLRGTMTAMKTKAKAIPTKAFFVRMLTRDITLTDCILDLVDNSVDGAWRTSGDKPAQIEVSDALSDYVIDIEATADKFVISDNCGGIDLDTAVEYAFTFGRVDDQPSAGFTVGVYGIGMKRAVFKIGNQIRITSTYDDGGTKRAFCVPIDVSAWLAASDEWDFDIEEAKPAATPGVRIEITELSEETKSQFEDPLYASRLLEDLEGDYMLPLLRGLRLTLNGKVIEGRQPTVREGEAFHPMRASFKDGDVTVELIAGMWKLPPDTADPEEESRADLTSGWYMLCNGRAVLASDRGPLTGWGLRLPRWHTQYVGFLGYVLFSSEHPEKLPMTTTKRSVDTSSGVYLRTLARMHDPTRAWVDYTNARKRDLDAAKVKERATQSTPISQIPKRATVSLPKSPKQTSNVANVLYAVDKDRLLALASAFGDRTMSYREVGLQSFDYAYDDLVDEVDE